MSQSDRASTYDFGPYEDEYRGFDMRDDDSGRGPLILILALGVLLIFAGVVWNTYRQGIRGADGSLPVLLGDQNAYKRVPDNQGGLQAAGQDNAYYSQMDGMGDPAQLRTFTRDSGATVDLAGASEAEIQAARQGAAAPITFKQPIERPAEALPQTDAPTAPIGESPATSARTGPIRLTNVQAGPAPAETAAATIEPTPSPAPVLRFDKGGDFQVQLSALRSEEAAQNAWNVIRGSEPSLYQGAPVQIQKADLGARGVFYRLRVGTFAGRERAKSFCDDVKATGRDCMVVAKSS